MKLFEKYLLASTNQRIPMPKDWQSTMGLSLAPNVQSHSEVPAEITGYRFQQNDVLQRGFVHRQVDSMQLNEEATYLLLLYLQALKEHKDIDARPYLTVGETTFLFPNYQHTVDIIKGLDYTIYGRTERSIRVELRNEALDNELIGVVEGDSLNPNSPLIIRPTELIDKYIAEKKTEKFKVRDIKDTVSITNGVFEYQGLVYKLVITSSTVTGVEVSNGSEVVTTLEISGNLTFQLFCSAYTLDSLTAPTKITIASSRLSIDGLAFVVGSHTVKEALDPEQPEELTDVTYPCLAVVQKQSDGSEAAGIPILVKNSKFMLNDLKYTATIISDAITEVTRPLTKETLSRVDEYYRLIVYSAVPVAIAPGAYPKTPFYRAVEEGVDDEGVAIIQKEPSFTAHVAYSGTEGLYYPLLLSKAGHFNLPFSNKLIPTLLDMNITSESPVEEQKLIPDTLLGEDYQQKILLNTKGIFDVDKNLGDKIVW